jgi:CheY-like chemotaxis protein
MVGAIDILLVEDNPGDVRLIIESLKDAEIRIMLHVVEDGVEAMNFLRREGKYNEAVRPDVILLDLNLPRKSGMEVLEEMKVDEDLKRIPVVILTTSEAEEDVRKSYSLHANCFVTKPTGLTQFNEVIKTMEKFWLTIVKLPN